MKIVKPNPEHFLLPEGTTALDVNGPAREWLDLPMLITPNKKMVCQWMPDANELALLNNGVPVTIMFLSDGIINPMSVGVGGMDLRT